MLSAPQLDFLSALFAPLLRVDEACYLLSDPSPQLVVRRLEDGTLRGVDISAEGPAAGRRELRIYRWSVDYLLLRAAGHRDFARTSRSGAPELPPDPPLEALLPHHRDCLRADETARLLNCTRRHVLNLGLPGPSLSPASGNDRTPRILRTGLIGFLASRQI